jgi:hypothetical protein
MKSDKKFSKLNFISLCLINLLATPGRPFQSSSPKAATVSAVIDSAIVGRIYGSTIF